MAYSTPKASQQLAARIAGFTLLLLIFSGLLSNFAFNAPLLVEGDAAATLHNLVAHEHTLRLSLATGIVMFNCDIILAVALFVLLKPVNEGLALLGILWRVANAFVLGAVDVYGFFIVGLPESSAWQAALSPTQMQVLIKSLHSFEHYGSYIGLMFFCLGAGVHSFLLFKSRYIPRVLSGLYLFACVEMLVCFFVVLLFPRQMPSIGFVWLIPDLVAEISVAAWLAFKGAAISSPTREANAA